MKLQKLLSYTRRAVDDYQMIASGDRIAVGISGGKDSLTLLYALHGLRRFYPNNFELQAITVDLGFPWFDLSKIEILCKQLEIPYTIVKSEIGQIIFQERKETNPCSLCAKMRKGALNEKAKELGCNKIAYAHHKDDVIETMLLSLLYEGRFHVFSPNYSSAPAAQGTAKRTLLYKLGLFFHSSGNPEAFQQLVIACLAEVERMFLSVFSGEIPPTGFP